MLSKTATKIFKRIFLAGLFLSLAGIVTVLCINGYVVRSTSGQILSPADAATLSDMECILVLGCYVHEDGDPSAMLSDRLQQGVALYDAGAASKLLMSGDHGQTSYDEVNTMKQYAIDAGVPSEDIFMDHAGFSTYESVYRARDIFEAKKIIIVTQKYHLHRALHIANALGLEAYGVASDPRAYAGQLFREVREILARNKDVVTAFFQPKPTFLGEPIPIFGDGDLTNDQIY